jgi:hypothetical protein
MIWVMSFWTSTGRKTPSGFGVGNIGRSWKRLLLSMWR